MSIPTINNSTSNNVSSATTINVDVPTNNSNQVLVAVICGIFGTGATPSIASAPSGWTEFRSIANTGSLFDSFASIYWNEGGVVDTTLSWTFSRDVSLGYITMYALDGADLTPEDGEDDATGTSTGHTVGPVTTGSNNALLFGAWVMASDKTPLSFASPSGWSEAGSYVDGAFFNIWIGTKGLATAGSSGSATGISSFAATSAMLMVGIQESQLPTAPTLTYPDGGETITIGTTQTLTCGAATSPIVAASSLQYEYQVSYNNGVSWETAMSLTAAGVTSKSWSTSGLSATTQALMRVRAWDGTNFGPYSTGLAFTLAVETTPAAPTNLSPNSTFPAQLRTATIRLSWTHMGGTSNPQTAASGEYSVNADMSSPTSFSSTTDEFEDFASATFTHGVTYFWRVRTTGLTLQSAYSAIASFVAANAPTAPVITAPTAGSPPTTPDPTVTFTVVAGELAKRRMRVEIASVEVYDDETYQTSTALSFVSPYNFANGVEAVLFLSIQSPYGLNSSEDSETFTPSYSGPAAPTITVTALDDQGCIQITIANSDTPSYNQIYRRLATESAGDEILIADVVALDGSFLDFNVKSGLEYVYYARAVNSTGLFTDSSTDSDTLNVELLWLHSLTKTASTSNAVASVGLRNLVGSQSLESEQVSARVVCRGRTSPLTVYGQHKLRRFTALCRIPSSDLAMKLLALRTIYNSNLPVGVKDQRGNLVFGRMANLTEIPNAGYTDAVIFVEETDYDPDLAGGTLLL